MNPDLLDFATTVGSALLLCISSGATLTRFFQRNLRVPALPKTKS